MLMQKGSQADNESKGKTRQLKGEPTERWWGGGGRVRRVPCLKCRVKVKKQMVRCKAIRYTKAKDEGKL